MHPLSLMLIDDDPILLNAFSDMLAINFPVVLVTAVDSGSAALAEVKKREYDIVICDLMMPGMDGAVTIAEIRKDHPSLRIYMMTGHPEPQKVYKDTQATGFIKKPLDREQFLDFMRRTIQVVEISKRATMRAREALSSSLKRQQDLEARLQPSELPWTDTQGSGSSQA